MHQKYMLLMMVVMIGAELKTIWYNIRTLEHSNNFTPAAYIFNSTGATECVAYLIKRGATVNLQDRIGITALHLAARNG